MCIKRLDGQGAKLKWPKTPEDMRSITPEQLHMLMEGLSID
ncbi:MAG: transposase, partial [Clostridiales bacterium]|nr:transposase [Clostridiales bacterium]